jgi:hypothetical protein
MKRMRIKIMNKNEMIEYSCIEDILSKEQNIVCLKKLYKEKGPITQDSLLAGLPEKSVPYNLDRSKFVDHVIQRLIERKSIKALFVLAAITWPYDIDLRMNLALIVNELNTPDKAIPDVWSGLRKQYKERLKQLWEELSRKREPYSYDVFISYSKNDTANVIPIASNLKHVDINPWLDVWEIRAGEVFPRKISDALSIVPIVAVFCGSTGLSQWQEEEVAIVMDRTVKTQCILVPVLLPGSNINLLSPFLKARQYIEFKDGKNSEAFSMLENIIKNEKKRLSHER